MKKILNKTLFILAINFCLISIQTSFAKEITDPDLKLSIEELKKKYPPALLDEKNKNYKSGQNIDIHKYSNAEIKAAFLNADENFLESKPVHKVVKIDQNSEMLVQEEIKTKNEFETMIIKKSCDAFAYYHTDMSNERKKLNSFILSEKIMNHIFTKIPEEIQHCFFEAQGGA